MQISIERKGEVNVLSVNGSLDALTSPELGRALDAQIDEGNFNLVADLTGVDYSSSSGLRVLLAATKRARDRGGDLRLAGVQKDVEKVLDLAGFSSIVNQYPDLESAIVSYGETA